MSDKDKQKEQDKAILKATQKIKDEHGPNCPCRYCNNE